ncbi:NAF domain [Arabidopsis suecica]|uniref:NAF domain n=1 Tax=Arabidopsis suecica TaxID=45249 RepID=A0A8T2AK11_ARASU|nr:NAF domain [Arabidopsis suecica]
MMVFDRRRLDRFIFGPPWSFNRRICGYQLDSRILGLIAVVFGDPFERVLVMGRDQYCGFLSNRFQISKFGCCQGGGLEELRAQFGGFNGDELFSPTGYFSKIFEVWLGIDGYPIGQREISEENGKILNAFDLISSASSSNLSGLFGNFVTPDHCDQFVSDESTAEIMRKVEEVVKQLNLRIAKKKERAIKLEVPHGVANVVVKVRRLTKELVMVEMKNKQRDVGLVWADALRQKLRRLINQKFIEVIGLWNQLRNASAGQDKFLDIMWVSSLETNLFMFTFYRFYIILESWVLTFNVETKICY